jgi:hypothetical protein
MSDFNYPLRHLRPKFPLGQIVMTVNAQHRLEPEDVNAGLARHAWCDWGELPALDREANDSAIWGGGRLLSSYQGRNGVRFSVLTEADRRTTTVLMPEDY